MCLNSIDVMICGNVSKNKKYFLCSSSNINSIIFSVKSKVNGTFEGKAISRGSLCIFQAPIYPLCLLHHYIVQILGSAIGYVVAVFGFVGFEAVVFLGKNAVATSAAHYCFDIGQR